MCMRSSPDGWRQTIAPSSAVRTTWPSARDSLTRWRLETWTRPRRSAESGASSLCAGRTPAHPQPQGMRHSRREERTMNDLVQQDQDETKTRQQTEWEQRRLLVQAIMDSLMSILDR